MQKQRAAAAIKAFAANPERRENVCKLNRRLRLLFGKNFLSVDENEYIGKMCLKGV